MKLAKLMETKRVKILKNVSHFPFTLIYSILVEGTKHVQQIKWSLQSK
jgi:hypothetical protein